MKKREEKKRKKEKKKIEKRIKTSSNYELRECVANSHQD